MKRSAMSKRGKLLTRYHSEIKFKCFAEIKADKHLAHVVFDQYKQAMKLLHDQAVEEEMELRRLAETNVPGGE